MQKTIYTMDQEILDEIIILKSQLRRNWTVLRDEKIPDADRKAAAENIVELQDKITKLDENFKPIDVKSGDYAKFLGIIKKEFEYKELNAPEIANIRQLARKLFETKFVIETLAKEEFKDYSNGPSVGQALQIIVDEMGLQQH